MHTTETGAAAATTLSEQIVQWATHRIQEQVFRPGMRMPSVRQLAVDRGVSGLELLGSDDRRAVELAVSAEMEAAARTARVLPDIASPAQGDMPWACPRCRSAG